MPDFKSGIAKTEDAQKLKESAACGAAFLFFALVTLHKLTSAPLWLDETVEYWYSKVMFGALPFEGSANMYKRIISTFQPPLYNVAMHFWLKFGDGEWWFRFFGVVMGFVGMIGIYKTMRKAANAYVAALAVAFSACVYQLAYYWQECAEYCLMLGSLFWTVYFWFCLIENPSTRNIVCFTVSAAIPVYSQYGAAFLVIAMAAVALVYVLALKDRKKAIAIIAADAAAAIVAALPLYFFFLKKQMLHQQGGKVSFRKLSFAGNPIYDFLYNLKEILKWNFFSHYSNEAVKIFFALILIMIVVALLLSKNVRLKLFIAANALAWVLYYIAVKLGIYSYGSFGFDSRYRYNLFFIPAWIVLFFLVAIESCSALLKRLPKSISAKRAEAKALCVGCGLCFVLCFCCYGWTSSLQDNWIKEDCRGAVDAWYKAGAQDSNTLVYNWTVSGFAYYARQSLEFNEATEKNVRYIGGNSEDAYRERLNSIYGENWPNEIYFLAAHTKPDMNIFIKLLVSNGYEREDIYSNNDGYLMRFSKP